YAVVSRAPAYGGTVKSYDARAATAAPGVVEVQEIAAAGRHGIAVVARSYWHARKAQQLLKIEWQTPTDAPSDASVWRQYEQDLDQDSGDTLRNDGNFRRAAKQATSQLHAEYRLPYLA